MPLTLVATSADSVNEKINLHYSELISDSEAISQHVKAQIRDWKIDALATLDEEFPLRSQEESLRRWKEKFTLIQASRDSLASAVDDFLSLCKVTGHPANESFWQAQYSKKTKAKIKNRNTELSDDLNLSATLLLEEWKKVLDKARADWELTTLHQLREKLLERLKSSLDLLQQLYDQLNDLDLDPGILLDLSKGNLTAQDISSFKRWATYLNEDEGVKRLCDLLGKLRQIGLSEKTELVKVTQSREIRLPDINSREEIIGIRLGRDIEYTLPSELALLSDPETTLLFDLKFVESRLMCFDMQDVQTSHESFETEKELKVQEKEKLGPMIICVDTSGSMHGIPETIAKAMTLFMTSKAKAQNRDCYLINFSTEIKVLDLANDFNMKTLIRFLRMSFHGGTDAAPALSHALNLMQEDNYEKADLLIISDFVMGSLPDEIHEKIEQQRTHGNSFYSLVIGSTFMNQRMENLFDHEWVFNPANSHIHELKRFQEHIDGFR